MHEIFIKKLIRRTCDDMRRTEFFLGGSRTVRNALLFFHSLQRKELQQSQHAASWLAVHLFRFCDAPFDAAAPPAFGFCAAAAPSFLLRCLSAGGDFGGATWAAEGSATAAAAAGAGTGCSCCSSTSSNAAAETGAACALIKPP